MADRRHVGIEGSLKLSEITIVSTFPSFERTSYAERFVRSVLDNWSSEIEVLIYVDELDQELPISSPNLTVELLTDADPAVINFKKSLKQVPLVTGKLSASAASSAVKDSEVESEYNYRFDAVRFAHKV